MWGGLIGCALMALGLFSFFHGVSRFDFQEMIGGIVCMILAGGIFIGMIFAGL